MRLKGVKQSVSDLGHRPFAPLCKPRHALDLVLRSYNGCRGAKRDPLNAGGVSPLLAAAFFGHAPVVDLLLTKCALHAHCLMAFSPQITTPLHQQHASVVAYKPTISSAHTYIAHTVRYIIADVCAITEGRSAASACSGQVSDLPCLANCRCAIIQLPLLAPPVAAAAKCAYGPGLMHAAMQGCECQPGRPGTQADGAALGGAQR